MTVWQWVGGLMALALGVFATTRSLERSLGKRLDDASAKLDQFREELSATTNQSRRGG